MKKKLLIAVHTLQLGGVEKIVINLLKMMDKEKYDITLLSLVNDGVFVEEALNIPGIKYKYFFESYLKKSRSDINSKHYKLSCKLMNIIWKWYLFLIKRFPSYLYKKNIQEVYDIEIAFLEGKVAKIIANSNNNQSKKIAWIHTDIENISRASIFNNLDDEINCYKKFDKIVCVSNDVKYHFTQKTGISNNVIVQVNPINSEEILRKSEEPITKDLKKDGIIISAVGRLAYEKGYDRLLKIHRKLLRENIKNTIWIIGEGAERENLERYIEENSLKDTVTLVGYSENPYKYVKESDVFVCSSRIEGLSSVVIEAALLNKPIVTTLCSGMKDILGKDNENALIVPNDIYNLYLGVKKVILNKNLREKYKENIKKVTQKFDMNTVISNIDKLLESLES